MVFEHGLGGSNMLYTIIPEEQIFPQEVETRKTTEIELEGVKMLVELTAPNQGRIVRLLSSNPYHFLNPKCKPGEIVEFLPVFECNVKDERF
jgi:hypothetical protein